MNSLTTRWISFLMLGLASGGCSSIDYKSLEPGKFSGSLVVMWVGKEMHRGTATSCLFQILTIRLFSRVPENTAFQSYDPA